MPEAFGGKEPGANYWSGLAASKGQRLTGVSLGDVFGMGARRLPRPRHDLGLTENGAQLVDNGGLYLP